MYDALTRNSPEVSRQLLEAAGDAVLLLDRGASVLNVSDAALLLLGQPQGSRALIDESFFKMLVQQDAQAAREAFRETTDNGTRTRACARLQDDPAGQWFDWQFSRLDAAQGAKSPVLAVARDATETRRLEQTLRHEAVHDKLTGLPNRVLFADRLSVTIAQARRRSSQFAVMMMDLDGFKKVNDAFGHQMGDALLRLVADRLASALRDTDTLARFGGDEFLILLPGATNEADILTVSRRLLVALQAPFELDNRQLYVSASIGGALFPRDGATEQSLMGAADVAMYKAKDAQGAQCIIYDGQQVNQAAASVCMEEGLYQAIREGQLRLFFQPLHGAATRRVEGFEALMRWDRPEFGLVSPAEFIPLAESNGLITLLGGWALKAACMQVQQFSQQAGRPLFMSVNVSPRQFRSDNFLSTVRTALALTSLPPQQLVLEITEGILMSDPARAAKVLEELAATGIRIAIDDFGTGYCSLAYLKSLPVHTLKIDRSFVKDLPGASKDAAICRAVLGMARDLGLSCTAEGIETPAQRDFLIENGCTYLQGYLLGKPMPAETLMPLLANPIVQAA